MCEGQDKCGFRKKVEKMAKCKDDCKPAGHFECWKDNCYLGIPTFALVGNMESLARILDIGNMK